MRLHSVVVDSFPLRTRLKSPLSVALPLDTRPSNRAISPLALDAQSESSSRTVTQPGVPVSRKSTPFLSPLAAMIRARYPSSTGRPTVKVVDETPEPAPDDESSVETEQAMEPVSESLSQADQVEAKSTMKSNGISHSPSSAHGNGRPFEKLTGVEEPPTPPPPLPGVT